MANANPLKLTILQLANHVLLAAPHPLTEEEVWEFAQKDEDLMAEYKSESRTPAASIGSALYVDTKDSDAHEASGSDFCRVGKKPEKVRFWLRSRPMPRGWTMDGKFRRGVAEHEPISDEPEELSPAKGSWCDQPWSKRGKKQPMIGVFLFVVMGNTRPSNEDETLAFGYVSLNKFHDKEPELIVQKIEEIDPEWFNSFPRKPSTPFDLKFKKAVVGELAKQYLRRGRAAYGKPDLRGPKGSSTNGTLAAL
jgi:hypothetical protein